jgi:hypothetical protein
LVPVASGDTRGPDPALSFGVQAEEIEPISNEEIDRLIYG